MQRRLVCSTPQCTIAASCTACAQRARQRVYFANYKQKHPERLRLSWRLHSVRRRGRPVRHDVSEEVAALSLTPALVRHKINADPASCPHLVSAVGLASPGPDALAVQFEARKRRPFTPDDDTIITEAFAKRGAEIVIDAFSVPLQGQHVQCLRPGQWLNDEVMNFYIEVLRERAERHETAAMAARAAGRAVAAVPRVHFFGTFFYLKLAKTSDGPYAYKNVQRWTRKLKATLFAFDLVLLPIHVHDTHWCLACIDMRTKTITYWDSLRAGTDDGCMQKLLRYLGDEARDKAPQMTFNASEWRLECVRDAPLQSNCVDCGVFVCKLADYLSEGRAPAFSQLDMPYFRRRILLEIKTKYIE